MDIRRSMIESKCSLPQKKQAGHRNYETFFLIDIRNNTGYEWIFKVMGTK